VCVLAHPVYSAKSPLLTHSSRASRIDRDGKSIIIADSLLCNARFGKNTKVNFIFIFLFIYLFIYSFIHSFIHTFIYFFGQCKNHTNQSWFLTMWAIKQNCFTFWGHLVYQRWNAYTSVLQQSRWRDRNTWKRPARSSWRATQRDARIRRTTWTGTRTATRCDRMPTAASSSRRRSRRESWSACWSSGAAKSRTPGPTSAARPTEKPAPSSFTSLKVCLELFT